MCAERSARVALLVEDNAGDADLGLPEAIGRAPAFVNESCRDHRRSERSRACARQSGSAARHRRETPEHTGGHPFTIDPEDGVTVIRMSTVEHFEARVTPRVSPGVAQLDREIREYIIDNKGMHVRNAFRNVYGIITGTPSDVFGDEKARLGDMVDN